MTAKRYFVQDVEKFQRRYEILVMVLFGHVSIKDVASKCALSAYRVSRMVAEATCGLSGGKRVNVRNARMLIRGNQKSALETEVIVQHFNDWLFKDLMIQKKIIDYVYKELWVLIECGERKKDVGEVSKEIGVRDSVAKCQLACVYGSIDNRFSKLISKNIRRKLLLLRSWCWRQTADQRNKFIKRNILKLIGDIYESDFPMDTLAGFVGCSTGYIDKCLHEANIKTRSPSVKTRFAKPKERIYTVDEEYFENLNEQSTYFLGFLFADGDVLSKGNIAHGIRIRVAPRDRDILKVFAKYIKTNAPITTITSNGKEQVKLEIWSRKLGEQLSKYGIVSNRTKKNIRPRIEKIPSQYHKEFWLGCFDGDGHIQRSRHASFELSGYEVGLCGNYETVRLFKTFIKKNSRKIYREINKWPKIRKNGNSKYCYKVLFHGPLALEVLSILYGNTNVSCLKRKRDVGKVLADVYERCLKNGLEVALTSDNKINFMNRHASRLPAKCRKVIDSVDWERLWLN